MAQIISSLNYIQQPAYQYNNPVSEASLEVLGSAINGLLDLLVPVGTILHSALSETQFNSQNNTGNWVLCDGRSCAGSNYESVSGNSTVPDFGGYFLRMKNTSGSVQNPDATALLGVQAFQNESHVHSLTDPTHSHAVSDPGHTHVSPQGGFGSDNQPTTPAYGSTGSGTIGAKNIGVNTTGITTQLASTGITMGTEGGNETRPVAATVNMFIRIN